MSPVELFSNDLPEDVFRLLIESEIIAWDIETTGLSWTEERIATCQIDSAQHGTFLVRSMDKPPGRLRDLLQNASVTKVFHHAPFDLRFMSYHWDVKARNVLCTKVASRILNPDPASENHSLKALLAKYLSVDVDKSQRLSNWLAHDLTIEQIEYASNDVRYLVPLLSAMQKEVASSGLADLYTACCDFLPTRVELEVGRWPDIFSY